MKKLLAAFAVLVLSICAGCGGSQSAAKNEPPDESKATRPKNLNDLADKAGVQAPNPGG
ncbi:MAG: hypothetical protein HUU46_18945 [Candidatus Hydrogenedentes bacterium]|nr:hypothetical protein [Candidatus Hydrogenedentota bacterium]